MKANTEANASNPKYLKLHEHLLKFETIQNRMRVWKHFKVIIELYKRRYTNLLQLKKLEQTKDYNSEIDRLIKFHWIYKRQLNELEQAVTAELNSK